MEAVFILMVIFGGVIGIIAVPKWLRAKYDPKVQALKALEDRRIREIESRHHDERRLLEERIEHLETIVTSVDLEFNQRLGRLLAAEESRMLPAMGGAEARALPPASTMPGTPGTASPPPSRPALVVPLSASPAGGGRAAAASSSALAAAPAPVTARESPSSAPLDATLPHATSGFDAPAPHGTEPGSVFAGRFEIRSMLGKGGMGVVYRAWDRQLGEEVAIKIAGAELAGDPTTVDRLRREAVSARRITHENVIRVFDLGEAGGRFFISMEYFAGERLSDIVARSGPPTLASVKNICQQIAAALGAAHAAAVVHRDLKPQNVMTNPAGRVKVIDFGIALAPHLRGLTATGLIMGTPEYMAPEQIRGEEVDARTDLYAMGCILYYLLTGAPPFRADTPIAVGFAHLRKEPTPPSHLREEVGRAWDEVCLRALAKDKAARFQTAGEMGEAIRRLST
jgi:serine/threonine-protein kinase